MTRHGSIVLVSATLLVAVLAGCTGASAPIAESSSSRTLSAAAREYLNTALDVMQRHALNRYRLNWAFLRRRALQEAAGAVSPADVYGVIGLTLGNLDDNFHSRFFAPGATHSLAGDAGLPAGGMLSPSLGYLSLPGDVVFSANRRYIAAAEAVLRSAERHQPCAWILDLRGNTGGALYPMLIGIQPLLGSGTVGYFVPPRAARPAVRVDPEAAYEGAKPVSRAVTPDHRDLSGTPVAVLTGPHTASSGEFVAVAFRGRPHTHSFGLPTAGVPTGNDVFRLSDGAQLLLTTVQDADRTGHVYPDAPIRPDQVVTTGSATPTTRRSDPTIQAAEHWLTANSACPG